MVCAIVQSTETHPYFRVNIFLLLIPSLSPSLSSLLSCIGHLTKSYVLSPSQALSFHNKPVRWIPLLPPFLMGKLRLEEVKLGNGGARIPNETRVTPESVPLETTLSNAGAYLVCPWILPVMRCSLASEAPVALSEKLSQGLSLSACGHRDASWNARMTRLVEAGPRLMLCSRAGTLCKSLVYGDGISLKAVRLEMGVL